MKYPIAREPPLVLFSHDFPAGQSLNGTTFRNGRRTYRHNGTMKRTARLFDGELQLVWFQRAVMRYHVNPE